MLFFLLTATLFGDETGVWRTAYVKRAFMGTVPAPTDRVVRSPTPVGFSGTKVRLYYRGGREAATDVVSYSLVQAAANSLTGTIQLPVYPITVGGKTNFTIPPVQGIPVVKSDILAIPITAGNWYIQEAYQPGSKMPYFYDADGSLLAATPAGPAAGTLACRGGMTWRVDVFTTDTRPLILCYGDSITQGAGATPRTGSRYPDLLSQELHFPVLNAGVNGDQLISNSGIPRYVKDEVAGVNLVVVLLGINDLCRGSIQALDQYTKPATGIVRGLRQSCPGVKVVWATLLPATGNKSFSNKPEKETLRVAINDWIRTNTMKADGIIDFDKALADPADPTHLKAEYHKDFTHPNDAGNRVMAQTAAPIIRQVLTPSQK